MQNIIICPKRHCVLSQKISGLLLKYNLEKHGIYIVKNQHTNFSTKAPRLCPSLLEQIHIKNCKEVNSILYSFLKNEPYYCFSKLFSTRNFSSTSNNSQQANNDSIKATDPGKDPKNKKELELALMKVLIMFLCFALSLNLLHGPLQRLEATDIDWHNFVQHLLLRGQVQEIIIHPEVVEVILKNGATIHGRKLSKVVYIKNSSHIKDVEATIRTLEKRIGIKMEDGIPIAYRNSGMRTAIWDAISVVALMMTVYFIFRGSEIKTTFNVFGDLRSARYTLVDPFAGKGVRFKDVAGLNEAKIEVMEFVDYLKNPERYKKLGAKVPKGALLLGPPGCGKTLLAKAVATESNVPFLSMNGSEFTDIIGGVGAARVRSLFAAAKKRAPSIIYIDEIDAIGKKRSDVSYSDDNESERTLNQLLVEMDGMTTAENIIIMASTNRSSVLDQALLRPGRFDRHILIDLPTLDERIQIFEYHLGSLSLEGAAQQYAKYLAHLTPGFSGAEIANVCNEAALHAATEKQRKVHDRDLMYAVDKVIGGTVKKTSTLAPSEKQVVVYHEAGHAVAAWLLEHVNPLIKITVVPRTNKRLGFAQYSDSNLKLQSSEHLFERMCVLLGGRVAETIMFNKVSTRAQNDLKKVTEMAYYQVQQFGMSPSVGLISFDKELTSTKNKKPYSKKLGNLMDAEVRRIITEAYKTTEKLLHDNKDKVTTIAEALLKQETLLYKDIEALIGPPPFGQKDLADLQ